MLNINGVTPKVIRVEKDGVTTELNVLKMHQNGVETSVWGKPFTLSKTGSNTSITVERTSSPNAHANTGILANGSTIYYGDVLIISAMPDSGYELSSLNVNNASFTTGSLLTVLSNITILAASIVKNHAPVLKSVSAANYSQGYFAIEGTIENPNSFAVTAYIYVGDQLFSAPSIEAGESISFNERRNNAFYQSAKLVVAFNDRSDMSTYMYLTPAYVAGTISPAVS